MSVALATNIVDFVRRQLSFSTGICQVFRCLLAKACKDRERKTFGKTKVAVQRQKRGPQMQRPLKAPGTQCVMARIDKSSGSSKRMQENARECKRSVAPGMQTCERMQLSAACYISDIS